MALPEIVRLISNRDRFLITSHIRPDGDAIGSLIGAVKLIQALGKQATAVMNNRVPDKYAFLQWAEEVLIVNEARSYGPFDCALILDAGEFDRIGDVTRLVNDRMSLVNIDHHVSNNGFGDAVSWVDTTASATSEMLLELYRALQVKPDPIAAMAMYIGIMTDTGRFRFSNTTSRSFAAAAALVECGAEPVIAAEKIYFTTKQPVLKALGQTLQRIELSEDGRIATTYLSLDEQGVDTEGFVDYIIAIEGVEVAAMFQEVKPNHYKISLRSSGKVNVAEIAEKFSGGGHLKAAGCRLPGPYEEAREIIRRACTSSMR